MASPLLAFPTYSNAVKKVDRPGCIEKVSSKYAFTIIHRSASMKCFRSSFPAVLALGFCTGLKGYLRASKPLLQVLVGSANNPWCVAWTSASPLLTVIQITRCVETIALRIHSPPSQSEQQSSTHISPRGLEPARALINPEDRTSAMRSG